MANPLLKTDEDYLERDSYSGALVNNNINEYLLFKSKRARDKMIDNIIADVDALKNDMSEIKNMLMLMIKGNLDG